MLPIAAGLTMLCIMLIPATMLFWPRATNGVTYPFGMPLGFTTVAAIGVALLVAVTLLHTGLRGTAGEPSGNRRVRFLQLLVGGLLLAATFFAFFWLMVWDSTYDPIGFIWLALLLPAAFVAGFLPLIARPSRMSVAGALLALLIPAGLLATYVIVQGVDFRQLTAARADRVGRAIESYYRREGNYPIGLAQLTLRDAVFRPGPVVIFGQDWCYEADGDSYQLAYVDRAHWSDPRLVGHIATSAGDMDGLSAPCAAEIDALIRQVPDYFQPGE